jgi:hypothetical protein
MIPESRGGWVGNYMARPKNDITVPGVRTFTIAMLDQEHQKVTSCSDFIGDGCMYYLVLEAQVLQTGISTDKLQHSLGGIFYQEALTITHLLAKCVPISTMAAGQEYASNAL